MEETVLLVNMALMLLIGGGCSILFKKLKMPAAIGYIVCGIILSNYWGGESGETEEIVELLSDLGLVLMMFGIGMELNLKKLRKMGGFATMVVMIQVPLMLAGGFVGGTLMGLDALQSIVFGAIISGSSTAVILIVLADQDRISHADIETLVLVTVIEDVAQVLVMSAISPLMAGSEMEISSIVIMFITVIIFMAVSMVVGLMFIPKFLDYIGSKFSDEILLIVALGLCFGLAYLSVCIGLSMAIGAFLMGVILSQSKTHVAIEHEVEPMKNVFMMMFFISIGLLIDPEVLIKNIPTILIIYLIYFILKGGSVILAYFLGNKPLRLSFYCSISLIAMGEFAFIISKEAINAGLISEDFYASVIGAALVSMIALPLINSKAEAICNFIQVKTPQPVVNGFMKFEVARTNVYTKMNLATKDTLKVFKARMATAYGTLIIIFLVQILFIIMSPMMSDAIDANTPPEFSKLLALMTVMTLNFLVLIPLLRKLYTSIKFLLRVYLDSERKAIEAGKGMSHVTTTRLLKSIIGINNWIFIVLTDFVILLCTPNNVSFLGHILVASAGILIVALIEFIAYMRRS